MQNYEESVEINHNLNWPYVPEHPGKILIISNQRSNYKLNQSINCLSMEEKK